MSFKQTRNKIMEYIINGNNRQQTSPNSVILEPHISKENNVEYNYLPFIDINKNGQLLKTTKNQPKLVSTTSPSDEIPSDTLTNIYIIGISFLGLYILNSILKKQI